MYHYIDVKHCAFPSKRKKKKKKKKCQERGSCAQQYVNPHTFISPTVPYSVNFIPYLSTSFGSRTRRQNGFTKTKIPRTQEATSIESEHVFVSTMVPLYIHAVIIHPSANKPRKQN